MAATKDKYSKNTINDKDGANSTKNIYALMPLALTEYSSDQNFKEKFFVHDVFHRKDSEDKECVLGLLNPSDTGVNTDFNQMHADARKGKLHLVKDGIDYIILNDGGLNTLAQCYLSSGILACYTNYVKIYCFLKSAYYVNTDYFEIYLYKVTGSGTSEVETFVDSKYLIVSDGTDTRVLPAKEQITQFVAAFKDIAGFSTGDKMRIKIISHNSEGTYAAPQSNAKDAIVKKAMTFLQVYYFATEPNRTTTDPTTGTPYAMLISEDMYTWSSQSPTQGGFLGILFNTYDAGDPYTMQSADYLQGASGTAEDAYEKVITTLPDGWYYGVPYKNYAGSDGLCYLQIYNSAAGLKYYYNNYVVTSYSIEMKMYGTHNSLTGIYTITVKARCTGTWTGTISISCPIYTMGIVPEYITTLNYTGNGSTSEFTIGTFTRTDAQADTWRTGDGGSHPTTAAPTPISINEYSISYRNIPEE